jgi:hypothetical protein
MNGIAILAAVVTAIALSGVNSAACAQESKDDEAFQQRLFGRPSDGRQIHACFSRVYDAAHLAQHPQQNVRAMLLLVRANSDSNQPNYELRLGVTFRKSGAHFDSAGNCGAIHDTSDVGGSAGVAHCGVDCDGGSIDVAIKDAKSVLVSIPNGARVWRAGSDDDVPASGRKRFGSDDKVFRLDKAALAECLRLADDGKEKAAMRRGQ